MKSTTKKIFFIIIFAVASIVFLVDSVSAATGTVTGSSVRIRKEALGTSEVISLATKGEKVEVLAEENGWYKVNFEDVTGYISVDFVDTDFQNSDSSSSTVEQNTTTDNETVNTTPDNTTDDSITDNTTSGNTTQTEELPVDSVEPSNTETTNNTEQSILNTQISMTQDIGVKNLPTFSSRNIGNIANGTTVTVVDELNKWVKITDGTITGWTLKNQVDGTAVQPNNQPTEPTEPSDSDTTDTPNTDTTPDDTTNVDTSNTSAVGKTGKINVDSARIRKEADGEVITVVDLNDKVEILAEEGDWYKINIEEHKGCYIAKRLVTLD